MSRHQQHQQYQEQQHQQQQHHHAENINEENGDDDEEEEEQEQDEESRSLQYLFGGGPEAVSTFFDQVYQNSCAVYSTPQRHDRTCSIHPTASFQPQDQSWNLERALENPLRCLVEQGWEVLCDLLDQPWQQQKQQLKQHQATTPAAAETTETAATALDDDLTPILFRDRTRISMEECVSKYSFLDSHCCSRSNNSDDHNISLWGAFLDGCSVVMNHCDRVSPWVAALCQDLQRSVPHAYANAYVTPAQSQAVPPHADDRDVFVVQVYGRKHWRVYQNIPIPHPYPHEQVGKDDPALPVPTSVLQGPLLLDLTLQPGDCLYLPRGYVHEARSGPDECSFHVTVACATHDWTLAGWLTETAERLWTGQIPLRRAVDRNWGRQRPLDQRRHRSNFVSDAHKQEEATQRQALLDGALQLLREEITVSTVEEALRSKYERHNQRAAQVRLPLMASYSTLIQTTRSIHTTVTVGRAAASTVTLQSWIRAATLAEKEQLLVSWRERQHHHQQQQLSLSSMPTQTPTPRVGLHVRTETYDGILALLKELQQPIPRQFQTVATLVLQQQQQQQQEKQEQGSTDNLQLICSLTLLSMVRRCVELGALAVVREPDL